MFAVQKGLEKAAAASDRAAEREALLAGLLTVPVAKKANWSDAERQQVAAPKIGASGADPFKE